MRWDVWDCVCVCVCVCVSTSFEVRNIFKVKLQMENILQMEKDFESGFLWGASPPLGRRWEKMDDVYHKQCDVIGL